MSDRLEDIRALRRRVWAHDENQEGDFKAHRFEVSQDILAWVAAVQVDEHGSELFESTHRGLIFMGHSLHLETP